MIPTILMGVLIGVCPKAAEIDFGPLPVGMRVPAYTLKFTMTTAKGEVLCESMRLGGRLDGQVVAQVVTDELEDAEWRYKLDGVKLTVYGSRTSPVAKVEFETEVAKPIIIWRLLPPAPLKK